MISIRDVVFIALGLAAATGEVARAQGLSTPHASRTIVIAELFTSEGCSSCPPADDLLRQLLATQPIEGVEIVGLGSHVDYWDRLGWRDPFSSPVFSERQAAYGRARFGSDAIYTPQLVVDGAFEVVGSDAAAVRRTLLTAAKAPKARVAVSAAPSSDTGIHVDVRVEVPAALERHAEADIMVAVIENGLSSQVQRGENRGRSLQHSAVVRSLVSVGRASTNAMTASAAAVVPRGSDAKLQNLRVVAFVQERVSRRIIGGGVVDVRRAQ